MRFKTVLTDLGLAYPIIQAPRVGRSDDSGPRGRGLQDGSRASSGHRTTRFSGRTAISNSFISLS